MKVGTKSVLFGAHQFIIHPIFVFIAWWKLYGFPRDPRLWVAFFVHDLGYWGKPNMDGPEGERHVEFGARVMTAIFDRMSGFKIWVNIAQPGQRPRFIGPWGQICLFHSRFYSKKMAMPFSRLCVADKLAVALEPWWLYLPRVIASGEIREYMQLAKARTDAGEPKYASMNVHTSDRRQWFADVCCYLRRWVDEHKDGRDDTWTPEQRTAVSESGVWK